jgi:hypothetical protein
VSLETRRKRGVKAQRGGGEEWRREMREERRPRKNCGMVKDGWPRRGQRLDFFFFRINVEFW